MAQLYPSGYKNQVKVSPLRILDPVHSGIEISFEKRYGVNYATQFSAACFIPNHYSRDYTNYKGFRIGIEEKYFFPQRVRNIYLSGELVYQKNSFNTVSTFVHSPSPGAAFQYMDSIQIMRRAVIINARLGRQLTWKRFVLDMSVGIGARFRNVIHNDKAYPGDKLIEPRHPNVPYEANREKNDAAFNLPANIRIGYLF